MFIRNCRCVAGWSSEDADQAFLARTLIDMPIVLGCRADAALVRSRSARR